LAITLKKYLLDGFVVEESAGKVMRATVPFIATGVPVLPAPGDERDPHVPWRALQAAGLPAYGDGYFDDPSCKVARRFVRGLKSETDDAHLRIDIFYEQPDFGFPLQPNQFSLTNSYTLVQRPTQRVQKFSGPTGPGQMKPLRVSWTDPANAANVVAEDSLTINPYGVLRIVTATAVTKDRILIDTFDGFAKCVNADTWFGHPKGYWLCTGPDTSISQFNATTPANSESRVSISFLTMQDEPWMYDGILRNQRDGKYVKVSQTDIDQMLSQGYVNDIVYPNGSATKGAMRVGPYRLRAFGTTFPFGVSGGGQQSGSGSGASTSR
jgi:hypothetical protein